jgi:small conductance mechanosensitive channel
MPNQQELSVLEFYLNKYGVPALTAIITLLIGLFLIKVVLKYTTKAFVAKDIEPTLAGFLINIISWGLKILLVITVAGIVGIPMTSFVAILGAAGLAIGLALQGTLSNFAGGILLMLFKPYKVDDFIQAQGELGTVKSIQIFTTILLTADNKTVFIPNGAIMNGNIQNLTLQEYRRVDLKIGVSYSADIKKTKEVLMEVLKNNKKVLTEPAPIVAVADLGDSAVIFNVRPFVLTADYWDVYSGVLEEVKIKLDENKIGIPFPQMDVNINKK